jgi:DNA excision repair protein ERCC-3
VQGDRSLLLEAHNDHYEAARDSLARFAELEKSPEHIHTYRLTPLSLWNAAASGLRVDQVLDSLTKFSKYDLPTNVVSDIRDYMNRFGHIKLRKAGEKLVLDVQDRPLAEQIAASRQLQPLLLTRLAASGVFEVDPINRGRVKQALVHFGYPAEDLAGFIEGAPLDVRLATVDGDGSPFLLRHYQQEAAEVFHAGGGPQGGNGVIVLPCGSGKTIIGLAAMARCRTATLILASSTVAVRQWRREILDKTTIGPDDIGEYTGETKDVRPVTLATYQILTYRSRRDEHYPHFKLFRARDWGLIIYDEVHLLPAPVFRITAELQARRRLGLTATLIREDGLESDVFSLIGPKRFDVPWKVLEHQGWIATAECHELRISMDEGLRMTYALAEDKVKYRVAAENPAKLVVAQKLAQLHHADCVLIIGQYLDQLEQIARDFGAPLITGKTPTREREFLYNAFRRAEIKLLIVSKVANFAIDLPDANVAIQVSGTFGSRQEEAQRLGRILRPKADGSVAHFYTLVSRDSRDQDFAAKRQLYLTEQGYHYDIQDVVVPEDEAQVNERATPAIS